MQLQSLILLKDYYNILHLPTHASLPEIKQAYRRLAMIHHPDKNDNDPYAAAKFSEIKEAYDVLTNPTRRDTWLQQRWYNQSIGRKRTGGSVTPVSILKLSLELEKYVSTLDEHRLSKEGLAHYVQELISIDTVEKLKTFNEPGINRQIITTVLQSMKPLPLKLTTQILPKLQTLAGDDDEAIQRVNNFIAQQRKDFLWERYKTVLIILLTLLICILIFLTTK